MEKRVISILILISALQGFSQDKPKNDYPKSLANYKDFKDLVIEVEKYRAERLLDLDAFLTMSKKENVVILDTRSKRHYDRKHIKGAIHLEFSEFTQENLDRLIPDTNTRILIYCNNNFEGDQIDFTSKIAKPLPTSAKPMVSIEKPITLALNIPTFINLYGYGYKNIYELDEFVHINDPRIEFEGTEVIN